MSNSENNHTWRKLRKVLPALLLLLAAVIFALNFDLPALKTFLEQHERAGLVIGFLVYGLLGVTPIPTEPVTLLILAWKGPLAATVLATLGNTTAAFIEFYIGGNIGDLADFEKKKEKLPFHLGRLPVGSPLFLLVARTLPGIGPKFVSLAAGVYRVPWPTYLWTTVVSNLLGAGIVVLGAYGLMTLF